MKHIITKMISFLFIIVLPWGAFSQKNTIISAYDTLDINGQFDHLYKKSNRYEDYKVISIDAYNALKSNIQDSISIYSNQITAHKVETKSLNDTIKDQAAKITNLINELESTKKVQDSVELLGKPITKKTYNAIMWSLVVCLLVLSAILFLLYKKGQTVVVETKKRLDEIQEEFDNHRKYALNKEQKLARELMDVRLRNKKQ